MQICINMGVDRSEKQQFFSIWQFDIQFADAHVIIYERAKMIQYTQDN